MAMEERSPLLPSSSARSRDAGGLGRSKLAAMIGGLALAAALVLVVAVHRGHGPASLLGLGKDGTSASGRFPGYMGKIQGSRGGVMGKGQVLYQDWRGVSLEQRDSFYFSHTWNGELNVGHTDNQHIVKPSSLEIEASAATNSPGKQTASETTAGGTLTGPPAPRAGTQGPGGALPPSFGKPAVPAPAADAAAAAAAAASPVVCTDASKLFKISLEGEGWDEGRCEGLVEAHKVVCGDSEMSAARNCKLAPSVWSVSDSKLVDDVKVADGGAKVTVSKLALLHAAPTAAKMDGVQGTVRSKRMQHVVMRVATDWGNRPDVADSILGRMFGATLKVPQGMTKLTEATTVEDGARFMPFKPRELMLMLEAWSDMPEHMHKVSGLRYVTRRQQGLNHPLYGSTTAVSWPTNLDQSYQEYMDFSFNADGYTARHLFIHEKTHFFWGREWSDKLKEDWEKLGGWEREEGTSHGWVTKRSTPFTSGYGSRNSPDEDMAESMASYVLHPNLLRARSEKKYDFFVKTMMAGRRYTEQPDVGFQVGSDSDGGYFGLPARVKRVSIKVVGGQDDDKDVLVEMLMDPGKGAWHSPSHVEVALSGPDSGSHTLQLKRDAGWVGDGSAKGLQKFVSNTTMSKYYEAGFWSAKQIKVTDDLSNTRWIMVDQYSWRLYLNNKKGTSWAPRYLAKTLDLKLTSEIDAKTKAAMPVFTATARFQQTGAPLQGGDKVPVWMRLAVHRSGKGGQAGLSENEWESSNGPGGSNYPLYKEGVCVKDATYQTDGTCTVRFELSPGWPAGDYYISQLMIADVAGNSRQQFFTRQPDGVVCCGRVGNQDDDEEPKFVRLPQCAAGTKLEAGAKQTCVVADNLDPELDVESVKASVTPGGVPPGSPAGTESVSRQAVVQFRARDLGGSGLGTMSCRIMDPQGFSHVVYVAHANAYTTVFDGDASAWGKYEARLELPKGSPPGEWKVEAIELHDKAGNRRSFQLIELLVFEPSAPAQLSGVGLG